VPQENGTFTQSDADLSKPPPESLLKSIALSPNRELPLHAQLRRALLEIIQQQCREGQKFYTEPLLIERLGVSQSTVRRALTDLTRDGYLIRQVAKGSFVHLPKPRQTELSINIFLPGWTYNSFLMGMLEVISSQCRAEGHTVRIHYTHKNDDPSRALRQVDQPAERSGIMLLSNDARTTMHLYWAFHDSGYRVVNLDTLIPNYPGPFVGIDNESIIKQGLEHLAGLGHQRIAYVINEAPDQANILERSVCFEREAERLGLKDATVLKTRFSETLDNCRSVYDMMGEMMENPNRPTALMCFTDPGAWGALKWLSENRVMVPDEISVIGFNDDRPSRFIHPALTTMAHPVRELAETAIRMIAQEEPPTEAVKLPARFILRESTGPVPD